MLKDIVINKEPVTFRGTIIEEVVVVGALILVGGFIHCEQIRTFTGAGMVKCRRLYRISFCYQVVDLYIWFALPSAIDGDQWEVQ